MSTLELEHIKHASSSSNNFSVHSDGSLTLGSLQSLSVSGNTGIGTSSPSASHKLTLDHTSNYGGISLKQSGTQVGQIIQEGGTGNVYVDADSGSLGGSLILRTTGGTTRMTIDGSGHVTQPYQPILSLQPDTSSNVTTADATHHIVGWKTVGGRQTLLRSGLTLSGASGTTIANGGSTGRITFSTGGVYYFDCTIRMENTPGAGNLKLRHNGNTIHRMHVEAWGRYNYAHAWISRCVTASANDYVEFIAAVPGGTFSGSNDTVNWLTIIKVA